MKVAIIGGSGNIGKYFVDEALARGHTVTAIVRHPEKITAKNTNLSIVKADVLKGNVDKLVKGYDAVISAYNSTFGPGAYEEHVKAVTEIVNGCKKAGVRLLAQGGAASLEIAPGVEMYTKMFTKKSNNPDTAKWEGSVRGTRELLYMLRKEKGLKWTYISPSGSLMPGERTGKYRVGKDTLLNNPDGSPSKLSLQDLAVAMIDELEKPKHTGERFTVAN